MATIKKNFFAIYGFLIISCVFSRELRIESEDDCWSKDRSPTMEKDYATIVKFSSKLAYGQANCSVELANPWSIDGQDGFAIFFPRSMDCGSTVTIQCLTESLLNNQTFPLPARFTCSNGKDRIQMPCRAIRVTYKRNLQSDDTKKSTHVQVLALAKGPCSSETTLFSCSRDYPQSCIYEKLKCNGKSECPNGEDERNCTVGPSDSTSIIFIILLVLGLLFFVCVLSTILICCCCRVAINGIIRNLRSTKRNQADEKSRNLNVTGEDAGLIKGLTEVESKVEVVNPTNRSIEPAALMIDSTKPIYPRLE